MSKAIQNILETGFIAVILTLFFFIGAIVSGREKWFSNVVVVNIIDSTKQLIERLTVDCETEIYTSIEIPKQSLLSGNKIWTFYLYTNASGIGCKATAVLNSKKIIHKSGGSDFYKDRSVVIELKDLTNQAEAAKTL